MTDTAKSIREKLAETLPTLVGNAVDAILATAPKPDADLKEGQALGKVAIANLQALMKLTDWVAAHELAEARDAERLAGLETAQALLAEVEARVARTEGEEDDG
jgi:hypothetical protein